MNACACVCVQCEPCPLYNVPAQYSACVRVCVHRNCVVSYIHKKTVSCCVVRIFDDDVRRCVCMHVCIYVCHVCNVA